MASPGHDGVGAATGGKMSPATAQRLAAIIIADAQQLEERSEEHGVTALLGRAVQRERPNQRFLGNTLRNLSSANRRAEEQAMWAAWQAAQRHHQQPGQGQGQQPRRAGPEQGQGVRGRGSSSWKRARSRSRSRSLERAGRSSRRRGSSRSRSRSREMQGRRRGEHAAGPQSDSGQRRSRSSSSERGSGLPSGRDSPRNAGREDARHGGQGAAVLAAAERAAQPSGSASSGSAGGNGINSDAADSDEQLRQWLGNSATVRGRGSTGPHADVAGPYLPSQAGMEQAAAAPRGPARPSFKPPADEERRRTAPNTSFLRGVLRAQQGLAAAGGDGEVDGGSGGLLGARSRDHTGGGSTTTNTTNSSSGSDGKDGSRARKRRHKRSTKSSSKRAKSSRKKEKHKKHKRHKRSKGSSKRSK